MYRTPPEPRATAMFWQVGSGLAVPSPRCQVSDASDRQVVEANSLAIRSNPHLGSRQWGCDVFEGWSWLAQPAGLRDHAILLAWACVRVRWPGWSWMTSTGGRASWGRAASAAAVAFRCRPPSVRRSPPTCGTGAPRADCRAVFLTVLAPVRAIRACSVGRILARACERTGQRPVGPHRACQVVLCMLI